MVSLSRFFAAAPLALLSAAVLSAPARAQSTAAVSFAPGFTGISSTAATEGVSSYNLGFTFSVNAPVVLTQLGYYYDTIYTTTHAVGLYGAGGLLLLSGTVTQADPLDGSFRYAAPSLPGFVLLPGQGYILSGVTGADDPFFEDVQTQDGTASALVTAPQITFGGAVSAVGGDLSANQFAASPESDPGLFGPNFQFTPQASPPVPEASTVASTGLLLLLGLSLAGVSAHRRRRTA